MLIRGPDRYNLTFDANTFAVLCAKGTPRFSGIATLKKPKLLYRKHRRETDLRGGYSATDS